MDACVYDWNGEPPSTDGREQFYQIGLGSNFLQAWKDAYQNGDWLSTGYFGQNGSFAAGSERGHSLAKLFDFDYRTFGTYTFECRSTVPFGGSRRYTQTFGQIYNGGPAFNGHLTPSNIVRHVGPHQILVDNLLTNIPGRVFIGSDPTPIEVGDQVIIRLETTQDGAIETRLVGGAVFDQTDNVGFTGCQDLIKLNIEVFINGVSKQTVSVVGAFFGKVCFAYQPVMSGYEPLNGLLPVPVNPQVDNMVISVV